MGKARASIRRTQSLVDFSALTPVERMKGDSNEDTRLLHEMANEGRKYLLSFRWCKRVRRVWFGWGIGGVCAVFLLEIEPSSKKIDKFLWVIVGDLPPAYLVVDASPNSLEALRNYVELMQEWIDSVKSGKSVRDCIPVNAPATLEFANLLQRRLNFLRKEFLREDKGARSRKGRTQA